MKKMRIEQVPSSTLVKLAYEGGGEVPDALKGHFTSHAEAQRALEVYQASQKSSKDEK